MNTQTGPAGLYHAWHQHFREILVPWSDLSPGNRAKWTAVYNEAFQSANVGKSQPVATTEESANKKGTR
jgi:hypothetical protein